MKIPNDSSFLVKFPYDRSDDSIHVLYYSQICIACLHNLCKEEWRKLANRNNRKKYHLRSFSNQSIIYPLECFTRAVQRKISIEIEWLLWGDEHTNKILLIFGRAQMPRNIVDWLMQTTKSYRHFIARFAHQKERYQKCQCPWYGIKDNSPIACFVTLWKKKWWNISSNKLVDSWFKLVSGSEITYDLSFYKCTDPIRSATEHICKPYVIEDFRASRHESDDDEKWKKKTIWRVNHLTTHRSKRSREIVFHLTAWNQHGIE